MERILYINKLISSFSYLKLGPKMFDRKILTIKWMAMNWSRTNVCEFTCRHVRIGSSKMKFWTDVQGAKTKHQIKSTRSVLLLYGYK